MNGVRHALACTCALLLLSAVPCGAADDAFSFYGLHFGMTRTAVAQVLPLQGTMAKAPGHGMLDLELVFDREDQLAEIRASWPRPEDPLAYQGVLRALREKFVTPTGARHPFVAATIDEYSNRAAVRLVFLATNIREKNIEYHKSQFLKTLQ